jgi:prepilin signal peptidase PulO-like enzyme (type II secretory pathway)
MYLHDTMDPYPSGAALRSAMDHYHHLFSHETLQWFYDYHALVMIAYLMAIDAIYAWFSAAREIRCRFVRLILVIDLPVLAALTIVYFVRDIWVDTWRLWGGPFDGIRFEAGAITFQLLVANTWIVVSDVLDWFQGTYPMAGGQPRLNPRAPQPRDGRGRFARPDQGGNHAA